MTDILKVLPEDKSIAVNSNNPPHRFTPETATLAAHSRWDGEKEEFIGSMIVAVRDVLGMDATPAQAKELLLAIPLLKKAMGGSVAAIKLAYQMLDAFPDPDRDRTITDARQLHFNTYVFNEKEAKDYLLQLMEANLPKTVAYVANQIREQGKEPFKVDVPVDLDER